VCHRWPVRLLLDRRIVSHDHVIPVDASAARVVYDPRLQYLQHELRLPVDDTLTEGLIAAEILELVGLALRELDNVFGKFASSWIPKL